MSTTKNENIDLRASGMNGKWWHEYYCSSCKAAVGHEEWMTQICLSCGSSVGGDRQCRNSRASRRFYDGKNWVIQHRYPDGSFGYSKMSCMAAIRAFAWPLTIAGLIAIITLIIYSAR